jgi:hypothetical protein
MNSVSGALAGIWGVSRLACKPGLLRSQLHTPATSLTVIALRDRKQYSYLHLFPAPGLRLTGRAGPDW